MPDEVKIQVSAPGAKRAASDLKGVAQAEGRVAASGRKAGRDVKKGADDSRQALDQLGSAVGVNTSLFRSWQMGAVGAVMAVVSVVRNALATVKELNRELRQYYRQFVDLSMQPQTQQLAQIRGAGEAETVRWMLEQARRHTIRPEDARDAAFAIESGLDPAAVGGRAGLEAIETAAFQTMRVTGASGRALSGLTIAATEAGIASTPAQFRAFFARASTYAKQSSVSLEQLADVAGTLLPAAVSAGMTEAQFMSMAAAMSFRIKEPGRLRTALEQMIRAAGTSSDRMTAEAEKMGRDAAEMSAVERMVLQSDIIAAAKAAGGLPGGAKAAEELGIPPELAQTYAAAFDKAVQARMAGLAATGSAATWEGAIAGRYAEVTGTPEAEAYRARIAGQATRQAESRRRAALHTMQERAEATYTRMRARGEDIPGIWEDVYSKETVVRHLVAEEIRRQMRAIAADPDVPESIREAAEDWDRSDPFSKLYGYTYYGTHSGDVAARARWGQTVINNHGVQYNNYNKKDPAGRRRRTGME